MEINQQFQNLHMENPNSKWVLKQLIERDICYLYHQLSSYSYIMGDLYFGEVYNLPYWDFINIDCLELQISDEDANFIREGCLVMLLTMAWEQIDGAGSYINDKIKKIIDCLNIFEPNNEKQIELQKIVLQAVNHAKHPCEELYKQVSEKSDWVHKEFVREYYRQIVYDFDNNPYFNK